MTREILFRGKRTDNGEWVYGCLVIRSMWYGQEVESPEYFILSGGEFHMDYYEHYEVAPSSIGQYTGLKDKNGRKIFEGDILMDHTDPEHPKAETRVVIKWLGLRWVLEEEGSDPDFAVEADDGAWETIGNIWDTPELLKELKE